MERLLKEGFIDLEGYFILHYHSLNINELQAMIILIVLRLEKMHTSLISAKLIASYMSVDEKTVDRYVVGLMTQQLLSLENNSISTSPLFKAMFKVTPSTLPKEEKVNLVQVFQKEFGRSLTPIEIETLREWKQCQYDDEMVLDALKEATLSNVHNMRYIEKILVDWAKHGKKTTGRQSVSSPEKSVELVQYDWWNEK